MRGRGARQRVGSQWRRGSALAILLMLKRSSHLHCTCARSHAPTSKSAGQREPRNDRCQAMLGHWAPCLPLHEVHGMNVLASSGTSAPERRQKCPSCFASPRAAIQPPFLPPSVTHSLCAHGTPPPHRTDHIIARRNEKRILILNHFKPG